MNLPNVRFNISSNGLGLLLADIQKIPGLVLTGATVVGANKVTMGNSYQIFSLTEAENLGIEKTGSNAFAWKHINDFYRKARKGAELWIMVVPAAKTLEEMADVNGVYAKKLLADASGKIRVLGMVRKSAGAETITAGIDADAELAAIKAQALAQQYADNYFPLRVIISGNKFNGVPADLKDFSTTDYNKVGIMISNNDGAPEASIGMALGKLASIPTQRKISRVKDGAVEELNAYFTNGERVETLDTAWNSIHNKNYIFLRNFANKSGYYFTGDATMTAPTNDFNSLARGFVMDEAVLIAYAVLVEELSDEIPVTESGKIHPAIIKGWQNEIESQIKAKMVDLGKLSGVKSVIDPDQDVLRTNNLDVDIQLLPVGYSDYITVNIGFTTTLE
ncbi:DUF2586 family protein [Flavobacterium caeni]|uniref:Phage tail sheath protein n=1 Tax=Flavobacterium caeni TaxID=490189 RepID=A0A1G5K287_9FLAO|nr:DUF2586 family protein [Flavobacterium caeni]SCY94697.1 hypothetical protein SAMN02927903_03046 [Flavobacterium caeni]